MEWSENEQDWEGNKEMSRVQYKCSLNRSIIAIITN